MPRCTQANGALLKALARAFRWRDLIKSAAHGTIEDLARVETVNPSYVSRILRLTLLAPDIVEAILDGTQGLELTLADLMRSLPAEWDGQRSFLGAAKG